MPFAHLLPIITVAFTKGIGCGVACGGACGNPMTKLFLASYLFTHSGKLKRTVWAFAAFYTGKIAAVVLLCVIAALLGSRIVSESGMMFGINLELVVQLLIFLFAVILIGRWIYANIIKPRRAAVPNDKTACGSGCAECENSCRQPTPADQDPPPAGLPKKLPLSVCGFISGISPCAPLILAVGYAATLSVLDAIIVGVVFSVASSLLPLVLLVVLTGLLSEEMFKDLPSKIRYFQLGAYALIAVISGFALINII